MDDPIGAVAVHGFAGIWGTLSLGLFAAGFGATGPTGADLSSPVKGEFLSRRNRSTRKAQDNR